MCPSEIRRMTAKAGAGFSAAASVTCEAVRDAQAPALTVVLTALGLLASLIFARPSWR